MARAWRRHGRFPAVSGKPAVTSDAEAPQAVQAMQASLTAVAERGSFAHGDCLCGWTGPGRRARAIAQSDVDVHRLVCPPAHPSDGTTAATFAASAGNIAAGDGVDPIVHRAAVAPGPN